HAARPPSTFLTLLPDLLLPFLRRALPRYRSHQVETDRQTGVGTVSRTRLILYAVRAVILALSRQRLLARAERMVAGGALVISDRFPSATVGATDSAQLDPMTLSDTVPFQRLSMCEQRLYRRIQPPGLVFCLTSSLATAIERNPSPDKDEPGGYVRQRHAPLTARQFRS